MRSRSNGGVIGAFSYPTKNYANGVFFIHDAAIYNTGANPIWPLSSGILLNVTTTGSVSVDANDSNYKIVSFTANGSFQVVTGSSEVEMLIVGGGGGGGASFVNTGGAMQAGGGGGSGAVVKLNQWINPGTTIDITVGTGGTGGTYSDHPTNGKLSKVVGNSFAFVALGGGRGSSYNSLGFTTGSQGGSGGGSGAQDTSGSIITSTQNAVYGYGYGNNGGAHLWASTYRVSSGGGGGAGGSGGAGVNAPNTGGSNGDGGYGYYWDRTNSYFATGGPGAYCDDSGIYSPNIINGGRLYTASNTYSYQTTFSTAPVNPTYGGGGAAGPLKYVSSSNLGILDAGAGRDGIVYIRYRYR